MNIVWIEDFGGNANSPYYLAWDLFQSLVRPGSTPLLDWRPADEPTPDLVSSYFSEIAPDHRITLIANVPKFLERFDYVDMCRDEDIFVIDINLAKDDKPPGTLPRPDEFSKVRDFHERGGLYIYNFLMARRFPRNRICFLTGHGDKLDKFTKNCAELLIETPTSFLKAGSGTSGSQTLPDFRDWLQTLAVDSQYLRLRRGVLNGIAWAQKLINELDDHALHFRKYLDNNGSDPFSTNDALDYLEAIEASLQIDVKRCDEHVFLHALLRAFSSDWDRAKNAFEQGSPEWSIGCVMKQVRNCLSHGKLLEKLTPADAALLFVLNFRAVFGGCGDPIRSYESELMGMFEDIATDIFFDEALIRQRLKEAWEDANLYFGDLKDRKLWTIDMEPVGKDKKRHEPRYFNELVRSIGRVTTKKQDDWRFSRLVMQMFWVGVARTSFKYGKKEVVVQAENWPRWVMEVNRLVFFQYFPRNRSAPLVGAPA